MHRETIAVLVHDRYQCDPVVKGLSEHGIAVRAIDRDSVEPGKPDAPAPDAALAEIGKKLAGTEGFGCNTCHGIGDVKATAAFEVEGINFTLAHERLRKEWFIRWMDNPASVTPATKMPRYSGDGQSQRPELEGDALKQFDAIWNYLQKP